MTSLHDAAARAEAREIRAALRATRGNREAAAARLGISLRTLQNRLKRYGIATRRRERA